MSEEKLKKVELEKYLLGNVVPITYSITRVEQKTEKSDLEMIE